MFLDSVDLTSLRAATIKRDMSNWLKVADKIYAVEDEAQLLIMLKMELTSKRREYIITRLYSRYNALRAKREKKELMEWEK